MLHEAAQFLLLQDTDERNNLSDDIFTFYVSRILRGSDDFIDMEYLGPFVDDLRFQLDSRADVCVRLNQAVFDFNAFVDHNASADDGIFNFTLDDTAVCDDGVLCACTAEVVGRAEIRSIGVDRPLL